MAQDTISIIRIETGEAVKSVNDLRENVKILKERLGDLQIGSREYQETLEELKTNQAAVKDAMYATSSSMEEVAANAKGINVVFDENNKLINKENQSYNALVNTMAELKTQWRATSDEAKRTELGKQIKEINDELKGLDASVGNYSRNVGDYTNSVKKALGDFPYFADPAKKAIKAVNDSASLLAANPVMGVIALVTPLVTKITESLKEDEGSMDAINKVMTAMKPIMDFFKGVLGDIVSHLTSVISSVGDFLGSSGLFNKVINGVVGVGNAILQFVIAPFKGVIEAIKVFKEQGVKGLGDAARAFANEMKSGVAFKSNYDAGTAMVEGMISGVKDKSKDAEKAGEDIGKGVTKGMEKGLADADKILQKLDKRLEEQRKLQEENIKDITSQIDAGYEDALASATKALEEQMMLDEMDRESAKQKAQDRIDTMFSVSDATSSILGTIADLYEADEQNSEKNAAKIKALRIASATIDTISGAIGAFMQATQTIPPPYGQIVGAAQAAAITAAGIGQIAQMKKTQISGSAGSAAPSAPAVTSAPSMQMNIPRVRNVTSASEEERLNQMAGDSRVVLVMSDLQVKQNQQRVQLAEASF